VPFPAGAAHIVKEGDIPLSDSDGEGTQKQRQPSSQAAAAAAARHPDEELEAELAEQQQQQQEEQQEVDSDWEPDAGVDSDGEGGVGGAPVRALSPPPVSAAELASGELEVVSADEDRRMIELLRQQVSYPAGQGRSGEGVGDGREPERKLACCKCAQLRSLSHTVDKGPPPHTHTRPQPTPLVPHPPGCCSSRPASVKAVK
jgi:hypothetical protein